LVAVRGLNSDGGGSGDYLECYEPLQLNNMKHTKIWLKMLESSTS